MGHLVHAGCHISRATSCKHWIKELALSAMCRTNNGVSSDYRDEEKGKAVPMGHNHAWAEEDPLEADLVRSGTAEAKASPTHRTC